MGRCPICGSKLIWMADFPADEVGYHYEDAIVSYWECSVCDAEIKVLFNKGEE